MKSLLNTMRFFAVMIVLLLTLSACGSAEKTEDSNKTENQETEVEDREASEHDSVQSGYLPAADSLFF